MQLDNNGRTVNERLGAARLQSRDISELIGLCKGVLADGVINPQEASFILQWLEDHRAITDVWPADYLYDTLDRMLEDGSLDNSEECELLGILTEITGVPIRVEVSVVSDGGAKLKSVERGMQTSTTLPLNEPEGGPKFEGMNFVMTGNFTYGSRKDCEKAVRERGGLPQKNVTAKTDYLVIGEVGSESWAQSSFGRKIEKAVYQREAGQTIYIISEATWRNYL